RHRPDDGERVVQRFLRPHWLIQHEVRIARALQGPRIARIERQRIEIRIARRRKILQQQRRPPLLQQRRDVLPRIKLPWRFYRDRPGAKEAGEQEHQEHNEELTRSYTLSPVLGGEGWGEGPVSVLKHRV